MVKYTRRIRRLSSSFLGQKTPPGYWPGGVFCLSRSEISVRGWGGGEFFPHERRDAGAQDLDGVQHLGARDHSGVHLEGDTPHGPRPDGFLGYA